MLISITASSTLVTNSFSSRFFSPASALLRMLALRSSSVSKSGPASLARSSLSSGLSYASIFFTVTVKVASLPAYMLCPSAGQPNTNSVVCPTLRPISFSSKPGGSMGFSWSGVTSQSVSFNTTVSSPPSTAAITLRTSMVNMSPYWLGRSTTCHEAYCSRYCSSRLSTRVSSTSAFGSSTRRSR